MDTTHISYNLKIPKSILLILHAIDIINYNLAFLLHFTGLHPSFHMFPSPWQESVDSSTFSSIKIKLPVLKYREYLKKCSNREQGERPISCAVCLRKVRKNDEVRELGNCQHIFHVHCIDAWIDVGKLTCPICRFKLAPVKWKLW